jgi:mannose-1-phosphate guanylyltransferase
MKALILAGGYGSRLGSLTKETPKCLMLVNGIPIIQIWIDKLFDLGINEILINTHYLHLQVEEYFKESKYKKQIKLIYEPILLGTAGTLIKNVKDLLGNDCFLLHADNFYNGTLNDMLDAHYKRPISCNMTMLTFHTEEPESCGIVVLNQNIVVDFKEKQKNAYGNLANGAIYILSKDLLDDIHLGKLDNAFDFSLEIIPQLMGRIWNYTIYESYIDIGTIENLKKANNL